MHMRVCAYTYMRTQSIDDVMCLKASLQYAARPCVASRQHVLTLAATQPNARIDLNPIPAFPRVAFTRQVKKICCISVYSLLAKFDANATHGLAAIL